MDTINEKIKQRLIKININYDEQKNAIINHLVKIETYLSSIEDNCNYAKKALSTLYKNKPSLLSISKETGISRQTLYNNQILKDYIELACSDIFVEDPKDEIIKNLQAKVENLTTIVDKLQMRDIQIEILHLENEQLRATIANLERNEAVIRAQKEEANKRLKELQKLLPKATLQESKQKSEIISINFK